MDSKEFRKRATHKSKTSKPANTKEKSARVMPGQFLRALRFREADGEVLVVTKQGETCYLNMDELKPLTPSPSS